MRSISAWMRADLSDGDSAELSTGAAAAVTFCTFREASSAPSSMPPARKVVGNLVTGIAQHVTVLKPRETKTRRGLGQIRHLIYIRRNNVFLPI